MRSPEVGATFCKKCGHYSHPDPGPCGSISGAHSACPCRLRLGHDEPHTCAPHGCRWVDATAATPRDLRARQRAASAQQRPGGAA